MLKTRLAIVSICIIWPCLGWSAVVQLPVTGQTTCFSPAGELIPCAGTGQDGELQKGMPWPAPRFTDNGNGTFTDKLTGLIWLKDAACLGLQRWDVAFEMVRAFSSGRCGLSDGSVPGDWRLPNVSELESLVNLSAVSPAMSPGQLFVNFDPSAYWASTTHAHYTANAWTVNLNDGSVGGDVKTLLYLVLPVRGGL